MFRRNRSQPRDAATLLPAASLQGLAAFGQSHFNGVEPDTAVQMFYIPGVDAGAREPERMIREVCEAATATGGWALVGASRVLMELAVPGLYENPVFGSLLDEELHFLKNSGASASRLRPWEKKRWIESQHLSPFANPLPEWTP